MARRKKEKLYYDPLRIDSGVLAQDTAVYDEYFVEESVNEDSITRVLENLLTELPERQRICVVMCVMSRMTYAEVGRALGCADQTARRETMRGLAKIKKALEDTPWARNMLLTLPEEPMSSKPVDFYEVLKKLGEEDNE